MSDTSYNTVKTPIGELCKQALEHYLELSDKARHYNSLIPEALAVYQRVREHYDKLNEVWESWTWQRGFEIGTASELNQLEEFLGFNSSEHTKKCPVCGANVEVTEFSDGTTLTRRDCMCSQVANVDKGERTDVVKSSQLGFEVPEDEAKV